MLRNFILLQKFEEFTAYFFPIVDRFPHKEKFALCTVIKVHCYSIVENMITAQSRKSTYHQHQEYEKIDEKIEYLRYLIRHSHERQFLAHHSFETSAKKVDEIGRILGRLLKPVEKSSAEKGLQ